jgi:hypothetical protein
MSWVTARRWQLLVGLIALVILAAVAIAASVHEQRTGTSASVTVAPDLFDQQGDLWGDGAGWETDPNLLVLSAQPDLAAAALAAATPRIMRIDEHGVELTDQQLDEGEPYTPSFIWPVFRTSRGPMLLVDLKGDLPKPQAATIVRTVAEELERRGVQAVITAPTSEERLGDHPDWFPSAPAG